MKIISWNCRKKFREKFKLITKYNADLYIIQECEDPSLVSSTDFTSFAKNYYWIGNNKNSGLAVFANSNTIMQKLNWQNHLLKYFLPIKVNNSFNLLAVWACFPYCEEYAVYKSINFNKYNKDMIIMGDFNSNKVFDDKNNNKERTWLSSVLKHKELGLISAYHEVNKEEQGKETLNTFYMHKHNVKNKGYHIDYCFINKNKLKSFQVLSTNENEINYWLQFSDHIPIILDFNNTKV